MPIRRHGRGWEVRIQHGGRRLSRTVASRQDALHLEAKLRQQVHDIRAGRTPTYSLEDALLRWLTGEATALRSKDNLKNKVRAIQPYAKGRRLDEVADVAERVIAEGQAAGLRPATINRRLAVLRRVARLAHRKWKWLERDEAGRIQLLPGEEPRYVQASEAQAEALLRAARGRPREAIRWAALTGLRAGELRRVEPHHFRDGCLLVERKTKTMKPRIVPLAAGLDPQDFPYGLTNRELTTAFREARERAGMPWLQFRDLRRTFGSWIVQKTRSLKLAQDLLGHTTPVITSQHYAHLLEGDLREAVKVLPTFAGQARGRGRKKKAA
jgi:integrase